MEPDLTEERRQAHAYLDRLPPEQLSAVRSLLETMVPSASRSGAIAAAENEPVSEEEERAAAEAREWLKHNTPIRHEEVLAEFGLTINDFERTGLTPVPPESK
jgi:hypothetical protein